MTWEDNLTLNLTRTQAIAMSVAILQVGTSEHRPEPLEEVRKKLRAGLDHRVKDQEEEEAELAILIHEYAKLRV